MQDATNITRIHEDRLHELREDASTIIAAAHQMPGIKKEEHAIIPAVDLFAITDELIRLRQRTDSIRTYHASEFARN